MLADPGLMEAELVEPLHQLQIAVETGRRIFVHGVERRQKGAVTKRDAGHMGFLLGLPSKRDSAMHPCYQGFPRRKPTRPRRIQHER